MFLLSSPLLGATGAFRGATECGSGPTKGREFPLSTVFGLGVRLLSLVAVVAATIVDVVVDVIVARTVTLGGVRRGVVPVILPSLGGG